LLSDFSALINGVSPEPSVPGELVSFSGSPSLLLGSLVPVLDALAPFEKALGIDFTSTIAPLIASASPPSWLTSLDGLTVTESTYDGMPVYDLTPANPSGDYVVAIHGGAYVDQPTILHWLAYTDMAQQTDATVVVPIYPLAPEGTAGTVEPELASLISSEIAANGASHVSVLGDSAGGGMALSAVELLVKDGDPVPHSMVLDSPTLDLTMTNPNIAFINDPVLSLADGRQDSLLWAGNLPLTDPLVSPLYGSLADLPPTYVYSGSNEILAPDVLVLEQDAIANDAPFSFILRSGELHDWALFPFADGGQVQPQIYQELGLTGASASAATGNADGLDTLQSGLQNLATEFASAFSSGVNLTDLSTDVTNLVSTISTDLTALSSDWSALVTDALMLF
jgi:triacylglycerol lipase